MAKSKLSKRNVAIASAVVIGGTSLTVGILSLPGIGTIDLTGLAAASIPPIAITIGALLIASLIAGGIWYACCKETTTADKQDLPKTKSTKSTEQLLAESADLRKRIKQTGQRYDQNMRLTEEVERKREAERVVLHQESKRLRQWHAQSSTHPSAISLSGNPNALHFTATQHSDTALSGEAQGTSTNATTSNFSQSAPRK